MSSNMTLFKSIQWNASCLYSFHVFTILLMLWYSIGKIGLTPLIIWEQVYMIFDCFYCVLLTISVYLREGTCLWRPRPLLFHNRWIHRLSRLLPWLMEPPHLSSIQKVCFILLLAPLEVCESCWYIIHFVFLTCMWKRWYCWNMSIHLILNQKIPYWYILHWSIGYHE